MHLNPQFKSNIFRCHSFSTNLSSNNQNNFKILSLIFCIFTNCCSCGKEGQGSKQEKRSKSRIKKGKEKANAATESSSDGKSDESIAFINSHCVAFIKDSTGAAAIIDTGASTHMTPHQGLLKNY